MKKNKFDVIVVGSGITGGWAAKEFSEAGKSTLVLERGRNVEHGQDYPTAMMNPWDFKNRNLRMEAEVIKEIPVQSSHCDESNRHFYVNDVKNPYVQHDPFKWIRGYQVGGRSITWGRQCYRMSDLDFEANKKDGHGVDWPIRYKDIEPWYEYVERYIGIAGNNESLDHLPDSKFIKGIPLNAIEVHLQDVIAKKFQDRHLISSRMANSTQKGNGKGACEYRNRCSRGCPFGGYFSSVSSTLIDAKESGNMTLRPNSVVRKILYSKEKKEAIGVEVIDRITKETMNFYAKVIFLNASSIASAAILLNSKNDDFPNGLGNTSGQVGQNLMDHAMNAGTTGEFTGLKHHYYKGRSPGSIYIPRFQNLNNQNQSNNFIRGYGLQGKGERKNWQNTSHKGFGKDLKMKLRKPGKWQFVLIGRGETLPQETNRITLERDKLDEWGMPLVHIHFKYGSNEQAIMNSMTEEAEKMLHAAGFEHVHSYRKNPDPGSAVHEMGTARMGKDCTSSVLNKDNQMHDITNIYITDGSCMTSSACQNPSLTYMALTVRACNHALKNFFDK